MSSDDKTEPLVDPEKSSNIDECKKQDEVFKDYPTPQRAGIMIDFGKTKPAFISPDKLDQVLKGQEGLVIICSLIRQVAYVAFFHREQLIAINDGSNDCPCPEGDTLAQQDREQLIAINDGSNDCPCPEGDTLAQQGCRCRHDPARGRCRVEYQGLDWGEFDCP